MFDQDPDADCDVNEFVPDFLTEVLASYTLVFSSARSRKIYKLSERPRMQKDGFVDPLLDELCGFQDSIWASFRSALSNIISPPDDRQVSTFTLPIMYPRFLKIYRYIQRREVHGITALYRDRRDSYKWWTLWAVIWVGGLSLLFSFLQTVIACVSLHYTMKSAV